ncbi:MAG: HAMP domain-containing histidine kinase [Flavobacteriales bacterium]|nr:HAMP domain-containing histidine kinase [Flavobacteriales bacterium]MCB9192344.1 HAMP domain-containing histidine kinase [Flavobacteriales bacterium]MCB9203714.1 HAMP domain-containing histidine kinase [Flavobacteriales bacterium]
MNIYSQKQRWKLLLVIIAMIIGVGSLMYTNQLVSRLAIEERKRVELWANGTKFLANSADQNADLSFVFEVVKSNTSIPLILTDGDMNIVSIRNFDEEKSEDEAYRKKQFANIIGKNEPIEINLFGNSKNFIYYDNSDLYYQLKYYPYVSLGIISIFILVAYFAFSFARRAEQDQVWVGMAKETAHQLGTPLSSLIAWIEYLRLKNVDSNTLDDMQKDVSRLETITERFSKIGSVPELNPENLAEVLADSFGYMESRSSKKVQFTLDTEAIKGQQIPMNVPLFAWVIENLCRNAIDAMEGAGAISCTVSDTNNAVHIDIEDTGKGIPRTNFETVFQPGYTSKKRGWGLGLSLTKRIIEQYHQGKVFVKQSEVGKGTTFRITLNKA